VRRIKLIGIGAGDPEYITQQAIRALQAVDVVFVTDKGDETVDLVRARREICERHMRGRPYRIVEIDDPKRDRSPVNYPAAVAAWHDARAALYERLFLECLAGGECGAFLVWGDPSLYDSALRIVRQMASRARTLFDLEVIPGISSVQALAARHQISMNGVGEAVHITTGRRLAGEPFPQNASVAVLLDGQCAFKSVAALDLDIYWGAYLGTPDEILLHGRLEQLGPQIEQARTAARERKGWIMDTYILRRREGAT
jgi:precorrin-6A synthase